MVQYCFVKDSSANTIYCHVLKKLVLYRCFDISQNNGMEYVSLKFPNFADTARIHYAATDFANGTGQVWCAGG